jgi:hypothetical protein
VSCGCSIRQEFSRFGELLSLYKEGRWVLANIMTKSCPLMLLEMPQNSWCKF